MHCTSAKRTKSSKTVLMNFVIIFSADLTNLKSETLFLLETVGY